MAKHLILISKFTSFKLNLLGVGCVEIVCSHVLLDTSELVFLLIRLLCKDNNGLNELLSYYVFPCGFLVHSLGPISGH